MLESIQAVSLLTIMEIVGPVLLLAVLIYGTLQWSRRRRGPTQAVREASTRELYREGAKAEKREEAGKAPAGEKLRRPAAAPAIGPHGKHQGLSDLTLRYRLRRRDMLIERMRKRLSADRSRFIEPCLAVPIRDAPVRVQLDSRNQTRRLPAHCPEGPCGHPASHQ